MIVPSFLLLLCNQATQNGSAFGLGNGIATVSAFTFNGPNPIRTLANTHNHHSRFYTVIPRTTTDGIWNRSRQLFATTEKPSSSSSSNASSNVSRSKKAVALAEWASSVGIKSNGVQVSSNSAGGLGLLATQTLNANDLLIQVPTSITLDVQTPHSSSSDANNSVQQLFFGRDTNQIYENASWWARLSLQLNYLDRVDSRRLLGSSNAKAADEDSMDMRPWLDSLPRQFDTPIHWTESELDELQYSHLTTATAVQSTAWKGEYDALVQASASNTPNANANTALSETISYQDFLWGCECARSRAFSGAYSGSAFNPAPYAFTLFLVTAYLALNLGTMEQAANGAGLVFCASVLRDFVVPKLTKTKRYVICPFIDMANHVGVREDANVAFEYFADGYSLAIGAGAASATGVSPGEEVFISYGARSNDQLLQYYGFVEEDNPHDVYVMPPLRQWDVAALESACGRTFQPGRLAKLDRAGLLGRSKEEQEDMLASRASQTANNSKTANDDDDEAANRGGGVVITRAGGIDPAVMTALRSLVSSNEEWDAAGEAIGNFAAEYSGGEENERLARLAARTALQIELDSKPTTLEEDERRLKLLSSGKSVIASDAERLALLFRIEKKKLLLETMQNLE